MCNRKTEDWRSRKRIHDRLLSEIPTTYVSFIWRAKCPCADSATLIEAFVSEDMTNMRFSM